MAQQISRTLTVRIWADGRCRLPKDCDDELESALNHAARMAADGFTSGEINPNDEKLRGWWEIETTDERA